MNSDDLTAEQQLIVELPVTDRALVIAGPGTGKTHTLRLRIVHLTETEQVIGSDELLVLSFTNAVVRELRERLSNHPRASAMRPTTIDSLARRIVAPLDGTTHDRVMALAIERVFSGSDGIAGELRHLIVDEIQDLGDLRRRFVEAILQASDAGCTLLGDPAQGIYGFGDGGVDVDPVGQLAKAPRIKIYPLTVEHRSLREQVRVPTGLREQVLSQDEAAWGGLRRHLRDIKPISSIDQLGMILERSDRSTGVLSRTNGEILYLSQELHKRRVPHQIKRRAEDAVVEEWPARVLAAVTATSLARNAFVDLIDEQLPTLDATAAWRTLKRIATGADGRAVSMPRLRSRLLDRPADLRAEELSDRPILSTIHRSKGLQYDRVILQEPVDREEDLLAESRVLYVAMTRARKRLVPLARQPPDGRLQLDVQQRWSLRSWQGRPLALEARVGDLVSAVPPGGGAATEVQEYIREMVQVGDPVRLRRRSITRDFEVVHDSTVVATTTPELGDAIERFFPDVPDALEGARVDALTTGVGDPGIAGELGLPASGLWLRVEISGFVNVSGGTRGQ